MRFLSALPWVVCGEEVTATQKINFTLDLTYRQRLGASFLGNPIYPRSLVFDNSGSIYNATIKMGGLNYIVPGVSVRVIQVQPDLDFIDFVHTDTTLDDAYITFHKDARTDSVVSLYNLAQNFSLGLLGSIRATPGIKSGTTLNPQNQWNTTDIPFYAGADITQLVQLFPARQTRNYLSFYTNCYVNNAGICTGAIAKLRYYDLNNVTYAEETFVNQATKIFENNFCPKGSIMMAINAQTPNATTLTCTGYIVAVEGY